MKSNIDIFKAETADQSEWSVEGWAFDSGSKTWSGYLELGGEKIGPISYGWPRPDVSFAHMMECVSENVGFKAHVFLPAGLKSGTHKLEFVFLNQLEEEVFRLDRTFAIEEEIAQGARRANTPRVKGDHPQAAFLNLLEKTLLSLPYIEGQETLLRKDGRDWPQFAHSMIGVERMRHLRACAEMVLEENIPGDFMETGVWRGGACILLRGVLRAYNDRSRKVWVADSFEGLPEPDPSRYPADEGDILYTFKELAISLDQVKEHFRRYDLLDDQVRFLKGFFSRTLPVAPVRQLSVLRLDGDMYESTMDALTHLYPKLSPGGFCIIDDYGCIPACRQAVRDYRASHGIDEPMAMIDWTGAWWRKEGVGNGGNKDAHETISSQRTSLPKAVPAEMKLGAKGADPLQARDGSEAVRPNHPQFADLVPMGQMAMKEPHFLHPTSAWLEHIPFAFWLVEHHRPRIIVELGVHTGPSLCAFCQAVLELGLDSRCFGIDTFGGDLHTGAYDSSILTELRAYHDPLYGGFSTLIQSRFENELDRFENGTIDLLHIDGLHYYESVKNDFEMWLPKLSRRGIVLFHDTNVHERDFGVSRLWAELKDKYPSMEFFHGFGLGVLAVGDDLGPAMASLFENKNGLEEVMRQFFSLLGSRLTLGIQSQKFMSLEREVPALHEQVAVISRDLKGQQDQQVILQKGFGDLVTQLAWEKKRSTALQNENELRHATSKIDALKLSVSRFGDRDTQTEDKSEKLRNLIIAQSFKSRFVAAFPWLSGRTSGKLCRQISGSGLFDPAFYASQLPAGFKPGNLPLHYLRVGWKLGLSPHRLFDVEWYRQTYKKKLKGRQPLSDFIGKGWKEKRRPHALFDTSWYLDRHAELTESGQNTLGDYLNHHREENRWPNPLFDNDWYLARYADQLVGGQSPLEHYLAEENAFKCRPNPLFDSEWYFETYLSESGSKVNPLVHFQEHGARNGFNPNPFFDTAWYLIQYPELKKAGVNPLEHFIHAGAIEGLNPHPLFDTQWYVQQYGELIMAKGNPLAHYLSEGARLGCKPNPEISASFYLEPNRPEITGERFLLIDYLRTCVWDANKSRAVLESEKVLKEFKVARKIMHTLEPWFDYVFYLANNPDVAMERINPLEHYYYWGEREGRKPSPAFDPAYYLETYQDLRSAELKNLFYHFVETGKNEGRRGV